MYYQSKYLSELRYIYIIVNVRGIYEELLFIECFFRYLGLPYYLLDFVLGKIKITSAAYS